MDKFYGYGIVDKDGVPVANFVDIDSVGGIYRVEHTVSRWNEKTQDSGVPFRPVGLFYKDEQSPCAHHHTCGTWDAEKQAYEKWVCLDCKKDLGADYYTKKQAAAKE